MHPTTIQQFKDYCLQNKYSTWYFNIVERAQDRNWTNKTAGQYVENHHVVPRSLGGKEMVYLTSKEHFVCHVLLSKMLSGDDKRKMCWAIMQMKGGKRYTNSRLYQTAKLSLSHSEETKRKLSERRKGTQAGCKNHNFGNKGSLNPLFGNTQTEEHKQKRIAKLRGRVHSEDAKKKMSQNRPHGPLGKKWFNDGEREFCVLPHLAPETWMSGRLTKGIR